MESSRPEMSHEILIYELMMYLSLMFCVKNYSLYIEGMNDNRSIGKFEVQLQHQVPFQQSIEWICFPALGSTNSSQVQFQRFPEKMRWMDMQSLLKQV